MDFFISHKSDDLLNILPLIDYLEKNGQQCWYAPRNIPSMSSYPAEIEKGINSCNAFLFFITNKLAEAEFQTNGNQHLLNELEIATSLNKIIICINLDGAKLIPGGSGISYLIKSKQSIVFDKIKDNEAVIASKINDTLSHIDKDFNNKNYLKQFTNFCQTYVSLSNLKTLNPSDSINILSATLNYHNFLIDPLYPKELFDSSAESDLYKACYNNYKEILKKFNLTEFEINSQIPLLIEKIEFFRINTPLLKKIKSNFLIIYEQQNINSKLPFLKLLIDFDLFIHNEKFSQNLYQLIDSFELLEPVLNYYNNFLFSNNLNTKSLKSLYELLLSDLTKIQDIENLNEKVQQDIMNYLFKKHNVVAIDFLILEQALEYQKYAEGKIEKVNDTKFKINQLIGEFNKFFNRFSEYNCSTITKKIIICVNIIIFISYYSFLYLLFEHESVLELIRFKYSLPFITIIIILHFFRKFFRKIFDMEQEDSSKSFQNAFKECEVYKNKANEILEAINSEYINYKKILKIIDEYKSLRVEMNLEKVLPLSTNLDIFYTLSSNFIADSSEVNTLVFSNENKIWRQSFTDNLNIVNSIDISFLEQEYKKSLDKIQIRENSYLVINSIRWSF